MKYGQKFALPEMRVMRAGQGKQEWLEQSIALIAKVHMNLNIKVNSEV